MKCRESVVYPHEKEFEKWMRVNNRVPTTLIWDSGDMV